MKRLPIVVVCALAAGAFLCGCGESETSSSGDSRSDKSDPAVTKAGPDRQPATTPDPVPLAPATQNKLQALESARQAGVLNDAEYESKKAELLAAATRTTAEATQGKLEALQAAYKSGILSDTEYRSKKAQLLAQPVADQTVKVTPNAAPATGKLTAYRDPQGRFQFQYPTGWVQRPLPKGDGMAVTKAESSFNVLLFPGAPTTAKLLDFVGEQVRKQWTGYQQLQRAQGNLAGHAAMQIEFQGVNSKGTPARARLLAFVTGRVGYALFLQAPRTEYAAAGPEWDVMLSSLTVGAAGKGAPTTQPSIAKTKGKTYRHVIGFSFWYPDGWAVKEHDNALQLVPPNPASAGGDPTELYFITGESVAGEGITSAADPGVAAYMDAQVQGLFPFVRRTDEPKAAAMNAGQGMEYNWRGENPQGHRVLARAFTSIIKDHGVALLAVGWEDPLNTRDADVRQIFASFGFGQSQKDPRLIGHWLYESHFFGMYGNFSSTTTRRLLLGPDGKFIDTQRMDAVLQTRDTPSEVPDSDGTGTLLGSSMASAAAPAERGGWAAANGKLYLFYDDESYAENTYEISYDDGKPIMLMTAANGKRTLWYKQ